VQDLFLTETARLADVVLPAASFAEKDGTFTNFEGRENRVYKAIEPPGESRADWEIILQMAEAMGHPMPFNSLDHVMNEIGELAYSQEDYIDLGSQDLDDSVSPDIPQVRGKQILKGFARFFPVEYSQPSDNDGDVYPLILITAADRFHFGSGTRSSRSFRLKKHSPGACIEINTFDCQKLDINQGDKVKITSPVSQVTAKVIPTENLPPGLLFMSGSFPDAPAASLFRISLDPETKAPSLRTCRVRLERV
jgi:formate dehydrogenase major subunit/formate dehydrogenase alpha subunit